MHKNISLTDLITNIPKAELHLHIEGTFEPELLFAIAHRNNISIPFQSVDALRAAYSFNNLQEFLNLYYQGADVLLHEQDFYDLTWAYFLKAKENNIIHSEIFFDPQTHTKRGVSFDAVINGIRKALVDAQDKLGISSRLIMCFLRDMSEESAFETLNQALPYRDWIIGVGLDSAEVGNPPSKFERVFAEARKLGLLTVAHAGEEGPAEYVREALNLLNITRIDHGNRCLDDDELLKEIVAKQIPLTVCPLSNLKLRVVMDMKDHPLKTMLKKGLMATVNSDDPAYFGGYINDNFIATAEAVGLEHEHIITLVKNSFAASFISNEEKAKNLQLVDEFVTNS